MCSRAMSHMIDNRLVNTTSRSVRQIVNCTVEGRTQAPEPRTQKRRGDLFAEITAELTCSGKVVVNEDPPTGALPRCGNDRLGT